MRAEPDPCAPRVPSACVGAGSGLLSRGERLAMRVLEPGGAEAPRLRFVSIGGLPVIVRATSRLLPETRSAFVAGVAQFLEARVRPMVEVDSALCHRTSHDEVEVIDLLSDGTVSAVYFLVAYGSSVRTNLDLFERYASCRPFDLIVRWGASDTTVGDVFAERWAPMRRAWTVSDGTCATEATLDAMARHRTASRGDHIEACLRHVDGDPLLAPLREATNWRGQATRFLESRDDDQLARLSEAGLFAWGRVRWG